MGVFSSLIQSLSAPITAAANVTSTALTNQANKDLAQYSYEQQKEMIKQQNEYNSPAAQMARYQEAGLNPNLIYGQIGSGNQSGIAKYEAPKMEAPQITNVMSDYLDLLAKGQTVKNLAEEGRSKVLQNQARQLENNYYAAIAQNRISRYQLDYDAISARKVATLLGIDIGKFRLNNLLPSESLIKSQEAALYPTRAALMKAQLQHQNFLNQWQSTNQWFDMINSSLNTIGRLFTPFAITKMRGR